VNNVLVDLSVHIDSQACSVVAIHVNARNLKWTRPDKEPSPVCALFIPIGNAEREIDRTETILRNPDPQWVRFFQAAYLFRSPQPLHFFVYDANDSNSLIGDAQIDLHSLVSNIRKPTTLPLRNESISNPGSIVISIEQARFSNAVLEGVVHAAHLPRMRTFSQTCPFFVFNRDIAGESVDVFRSETMPKMTTGAWPSFRIPVQFLSGGDPDAPVRLIVKDDCSKKPPIEIGRLVTSANGLIRFSETKAVIPLVMGKDRKGSPSLQFEGQLTKQVSFVNYLQNGLSLDLITGIDYTRSNGDIRNVSSLHHVVAGRANVYENCIQVLGSLIGMYDTDQRFPLFGFGGEYHGQVDHCFPVNGHDADPVVVGLDGILQAYHDSLSTIKLSGPTWFTPLIRKATEFARQGWETHTYTILLIITDGSHQDIESTIDAIVEASETALSILIVGVGTADFDSMYTLDSDDKILRSTKGVPAKRDILQFVRFRDYERLPEASRNIRLSGALLEEIPAQVHSFCSTHGFSVDVA
jgi:hypothetical protein